MGYSHYNVTCVRPHTSSSTDLVMVFQNHFGTYFLSITMVLGQPAGLSKEVLSVRRR